jgi:hypothetical protein
MFLLLVVESLSCFTSTWWGHWYGKKTTLSKFDHQNQFTCNHPEVLVDDTACREKKNNCPNMVAKSHYFQSPPSNWWHHMKKKNGFIQVQSPNPFTSSHPLLVIDATWKKIGYTKFGCFIALLLVAPTLFEYGWLVVSCPPCINLVATCPSNCYATKKINSCDEI